MSHKIQIGKDVAQFVQRILFAGRKGKFSEDISDEGILKMIEGMSVTVTDKELTEWTRKTNVKDI